MRNALMSIIILQAFYANAQENTAISVLQKVEDALSRSQEISYDYAREMRYYSDNYHYQESAHVYLDYREKGLIGFRFQATQDSSKFIFDGKQTLRLDQTNMTIDSQYVRSIARMDANSYLFHSLAMLKILIPQVIQNDSIQKTLTDTAVDGEKLFCVGMEAPQTYFGIFKGINHFNVAGLRRPYYLLIDKKTFLPRQFISRIVRNEDDRDFITMIYSNINNHPERPSAASWNYQSYAGTYHPPVVKEKKKRIEAGAMIPDIRLPWYKNNKTLDTLSVHSLKGKVTLLEFWIKGCGPCMEAMPHYNDLKKKYAATDFELVTINAIDEVDDIKFFYNKYHPIYPMLFQGESWFENLGLEAYPTSILLDKNGKVLQVFLGFSQSDIEKQIDAALSAGFDQAVTGFAL